jgi:PPOX class probable F420-dependent enzyme
VKIDVSTALTFLRDNHRAVLATTRADGHPQLSPIVANVNADGLIAISSRETAVKVKNLRRDPYASLCVIGEGFYGEWMQIEGTASILSLPDAMEPLVDYYRTLSGEHPDWADYRAAMERDLRVVILIRAERAGPNVSG